MQRRSYSCCVQNTAPFRARSNTRRGVNRTAESILSRLSGFGGEQSRGKNSYLNQIPFEENRNDIDNDTRLAIPHKNSKRRRL